MIVGIDLGTTNSLVAVVQDGLARVLKPEGGSGLLPSAVRFDASGSVRVGEVAKRDRVLHPESTIFSTKRLLGRKLADLQGLGISLPYALEESGSEIRIRVGDRALSPVDVAASILRELKSRAEKALGEPVTQAVVTVPAYFNDSQRQATRLAGRLANLDIVRIINEPTAAALAYGWDRSRDGVIAVYDLGGGTFDLSILRLSDGVFEVLATRGDTALGGDDIDVALAKLLDPAAESDLELWAALLEEGERVKKELATQPRARTYLKWKGREIARDWTVQELSAVVRPILERTREPTLAALADAGLKPSDLDDVVLVGGPSRLPQVREYVRELLGREPNQTLPRVGKAADQVADEVVALGAAIQADILAGNRPELLLLDVVPLSLGIETYGGVTSVLIPRNAKVPAMARETFTTYVDHQTGVDIHVVQGERDQVADNRSLGRFKLSGLEPQPAGFPRIEVSFLVDADGILQVSAKDLKTGRTQAIEVRPSYGLSESEIAERIAAGAENAESDVAFRQWVDVLTETEPVLKAAEQRLPDARRLLAPSEVARIEDAIRGLRTLIEKKDGPAVKSAARDLGQATQKLAELVLKEALNTASRKQ